MVLIHKCHPILHGTQIDEKKAPLIKQLPIWYNRCTNYKFDFFTLKPGDFGWPSCS
jgi:hypothetical protein